MPRALPSHLVALAVLAGVLCAASAAAQPSGGAPVSTVEVWVAVVSTTWTRPGTLDTSYPLQVASVPDATGRFSQSLVLDPARGTGIDLGVNLFPSRHVGLRVFASRVAADLGGANAPYEVDLRYTSRPPPNYEPVPVAMRWSVDWPDTTGRLRQWTVGAGPALRWPGAAVSAVVSGGLAWVRLSGEAAPLGYTRLWLGGHSVLFSENVQVRAALGPSTLFGGYVSGALDIALGPHAAVTLGARAVLAGDADVTARVDAVLDAGEATAARDVDAIDRAMAPGPARVSPRGVVLLAGVKLR